MPLWDLENELFDETYGRYRGALEWLSGSEENNVTTIICSDSKSSQYACGYTGHIH